MENRFKQQFVSLTLVWTAILISYCLLTGIIFYIAKSGEASPDKTLNAVYSYISIFSIMALIPASYYIYGVFAKKGKKMDSETEKIDFYRKAFIYKIACIEFAGFLSLIAYYVSHQMQCLFMTAIPMLVLLINKPTEKRFLEDFFEQDAHGDSTDEHLLNP